MIDDKLKLARSMTTTEKEARFLLKYWDNCAKAAAAQQPQTQAEAQAQLAELRRLSRSRRMRKESHEKPEI